MGRIDLLILLRGVVSVDEAAVVLVALQVDAVLLQAVACSVVEEATVHRVTAATTLLQGTTMMDRSSARSTARRTTLLLNVGIASISLMFQNRRLLHLR
jgi:hypothetical protein